jgi:hypothetical protein
MLVTSCFLAAFMLPPATVMPRTSLTTFQMKADAADSDDADKPQVHLEALGSIVEFDDGKHDRSMLGVVSSAEAKAKGGARYTVLDANSVPHSIAGKQIHCSFSPDAKAKKADPEVVLKPFETVHDLEPTALGVAPEDLELAWEFLAEEDNDSWSARSILQNIDDKLCRTPVEQYKAFRLLTSDLGHVFFKSLSGGFYKLKNAKSVRASKDQWCRAHEEADFCFV